MPGRAAIYLYVCFYWRIIGRPAWDREIELGTSRFSAPSGGTLHQSPLSQTAASREELFEAPGRLPFRQAFLGHQAAARQPQGQSCHCDHYRALRERKFPTRRQPLWDQAVVDQPCDHSRHGGVAHHRHWTAWRTGGEKGSKERAPEEGGPDVGGAPNERVAQVGLVMCPRFLAPEPVAAGVDRCPGASPLQPRADDEGRGGGQGGSGAAEESIPEKLHGPPRLLHELNRATAGLFPTKARSLRSSQASE